MRELTLEELELVAGGTTSTGDIIVIGDRGGGDDFGDFGDFGDYGDYGDDMGGGGGSGDSGSSSPAEHLLDAHGSAHAENNSSNHSAEATKAISDLQQGLVDQMTAAMAHSGSITLPDGSVLTQSQMENYLSRVQFEAVDTVFGDGRAGANTVSADGLIHVQINVDQLIGYDQQGMAGADYLIAHEIAHDTSAGIAESSAMWQQYLHEPGVSAMTDAQKTANYPNSTEFQQNEAWANSAGKDITDALGIGNISNPTNGYLPDK